MSQQIDDLEKLSNAEIHSKCIELGLPNVPVTDTSRSVLIRKLRSVMNPKTNNRRSMTHNDKPAKQMSPKANSALRSTKSNRKLASESDEVSDEPTPVVSNVRHKLKQRSIFNISTSGDKPTNDFQHETFSSHDATYPKSCNGPSSQKTEDPRMRRSVSLSKSEVITTSYNQETTSVPMEIDIEEEYEDDYDEEEEAQVSGGYNANFSNLYYTPRTLYNSYSPPKASTSQHTLMKQENTYPTGSSKLSNQAKLTENQSHHLPAQPIYEKTIHTSTYEPKLYPSLRHIVPEGTSHTLAPNPTSRLNYSNTSYTTTYLPDTENLSSSYSDYDFIKNSNSNVDDDLFSSDDAEDQTNSSAYHSNYSNNSRNKSKSTERKRHRSSNTFTKPRPAVSTYAEYNDGTAASFQNLMYTLEQNYHLKKSAVVVMIFLVSMYIYVNFLK